MPEPFVALLGVHVIVGIQALKVMWYGLQCTVMHSVPVYRQVALTVAVTAAIAAVPSANGILCRRTLFLSPSDARQQVLLFTG